MLDIPISDALALGATASALDTQRGKLPVLGDPHRSPDAVAVYRQISELGKLITELGDEGLFRVAQQDHAPHATRVITGFAAAVEPAGQAVAALGTVAHQLAFLAQTGHVRDQADARDAREAAVRVLEDALAAADAALHDAADLLYAASATPSPSSGRLQAARSRSTVPVPAVGPPSPGATATAAARSGRAVRGR